MSNCLLHTEQNYKNLSKEFVKQEANEIWSALNSQEVKDTLKVDKIVINEDLTVQNNIGKTINASDYVNKELHKDIKKIRAIRGDYRVYNTNGTYRRFADNDIGRKALSGVVDNINKNYTDVMALPIELIPLYEEKGKFFGVDIVKADKRNLDLSKESDMELNSLLSGFLKDLGVSVRVVNEILGNQTIHGRIYTTKDKMDKFQVMVEIANGSKKQMTEALAEEVSHLALELNGWTSDDSIQMLRHIQSTKYFEDVKQEYPDADLMWQAKEAAGRLMKDVLLNNYQKENVNKTIWDDFKAFLDKILSLFKKTSPERYNDEIIKKYEAIKDKILKRDTDSLSMANIDGAFEYFNTVPAQASAQLEEMGRDFKAVRKDTNHLSVSKVISKMFQFKGTTKRSQEELEAKADRGTFLHNALDKNSLDAVESKLGHKITDEAKEMLLNKVKTMSIGQAIELHEIPIADKTLNITAIIDMLLYDTETGEYSIVDFKIKDEDFKGPSKDEHLKNSTQLGLYKYMIETNTNIRISHLYNLYIPVEMTGQTVTGIKNPIKYQATYTDSKITSALELQFPGKFNKSKYLQSFQVLDKANEKDVTNNTKIITNIDNRIAYLRQQKGDNSKEISDLTNQREIAEEAVRNGHTTRAISENLKAGYTTAVATIRKMDAVIKTIGLGDISIKGKDRLGFDIIINEDIDFKSIEEIKSEYSDLSENLIETLKRFDADTLQSMMKMLDEADKGITFFSSIVPFKELVGEDKTLDVNGTSKTTSQILSDIETNSQELKDIVTQYKEAIMKATLDVENTIQDGTTIEDNMKMAVNEITGTNKSLGYIDNMQDFVVSTIAKIFKTQVHQPLTQKIHAFNVNHNKLKEKVFKDATDIRTAFEFMVEKDTKTGKNLPYVTRKGNKEFYDNFAELVGEFYNAKADVNAAKGQDASNDTIEALKRVKRSAVVKLAKYQLDNCVFEDKSIEDALRLLTTTADNKVFAEHTKTALALNDPRIVSKQYQKIQSNPVQKEYYDFYMKHKKEADSMLPDMFKNPYAMINGKRSFLEATAKNGLLTAMRGLGKDIGESIGFNAQEQIKEDTYTVKDVNGNVIAFIPYKNSSLKGITSYEAEIAKGESMSIDIPKLFNEYIYMANSYDLKYKYQTLIEAALEYTKNRQNVVKRTSLGTIITDEKGNPQTIEGIESNNYKRFKEWVEKIFYEKQEEERVVSLGPLGKVNINQSANWLMGYNSLRVMAFNVFSMVNNATWGVVTNIIEAAGGQSFSLRTLGSSVNRLWDSEDRDKINHIFDAFDILQNTSEQERSKKTITGLGATLGLGRTKYRDLSISDIGFAPFKASEYVVQTTALTAMLLERKVKSTTGVEMTLLDAIELDENMAPRLKKGIAEANEGLNLEYEMFKAKSLLMDMHGRYSRVDQNVLQGYVLGKMAMQFRKWMYPAYEIRWKKLHVDPRFGKLNEGRYRTIARKATQLFKVKNEMIAELRKEQKGELSQLEAANLRRAAMEVALLAAIFLLRMAAKSTDDDDDKKEQNPFTNFMVWQLDRLNSEFYAFISPITGVELAMSPAATISLITVAYDVIDATRKNIMDPGGKENYYQRGAFKDELKLKIHMYKLIPFLKEYRRIRALSHVYEYNTLVR